MKHKIKSIFYLLSNNKLAFFFCVIILFVTSCFEYFFLTNFLIIIDGILLKSTHTLSKMFLIYTIFLFLLKIASQILGTIAILISVKKLNIQTGVSAIKRNLGAKGISSDIAVKNIQSDVFYFGELIKTLLFILQDAVIFLAASIVLSKVIGTYGALLFLLIFLIFCFAGYFLKDYLIALGSKRAVAFSMIISKLVEFNRHWDIIKTSGKHDRAYGNLTLYLNKLYHFDYVRGLIASIPKNLSEILILFLLISWMILPGDTANSILGLLLVTSLRIFPIIGRLLSNVQIMLFNLSSIENLTKDIENHQINKSIKYRVPYEWKKIHCTGIGISIDKNKIIQSKNISVMNGQKVALVGRNGSGKSTLLKVLIGLQDTQTISHTGKIIVDGRKVDSLSDLLDIAYISQETAIFSGTILENITLDFGLQNDDLSISKILTLATTLNVFAIMQKMDVDYLTTQVSPEKPVLSGGEWQVISLLRALYNGYKFLIIDEGNSALDNTNSNELLKYLCSRKDITLIFVNHRENDDTYFDEKIDLSAK